MAGGAEGENSGDEGAGAALRRNAGPEADIQAVAESSREDGE